MQTHALMVFILCAYLFGSVCSAVIVCKLFQLPDPRVVGSKNPGATNVLRLAGKWFALVVLFADGLKGALPVGLAAASHATDTQLGWIGLAAVVGHIYPIFFGFKGGKGVATVLGVLLGFNPEFGATVVAIWLLVACIGRYSSLASLVSLGCLPGLSLWFAPGSNAWLPFLLMTLLTWYQHRGNWQRLTNGTESTIQLKRKFK